MVAWLGLRPVAVWRDKGGRERRCGRSLGSLGLVVVILDRDRVRYGIEVKLSFAHA